MSTSEATVFIVDDDAAVRKSLTMLLQEVGLKVRTFPDAGAFIKAYDPVCPGCLVVDVRMPDMSGMELQDKLTAADCRIPIIMITGHGDIPMAVEAMKKGALDFMEKPFREHVLLKNIHKALQQDAQYRQTKLEKETFLQRLALLTERQREVMNLLLKDMSSKQIALQLNISPKTADFHRAHIFEIMQVDSILELYRKANQYGLTNKTVDETQNDRMGTTP